MAFLALAHRHARAVPEALVRFSLLVIVVAARAQRRAQFIFMLRQAL